jgi:hypothetical protein
VRASVANRLLAAAGFSKLHVPGGVGAADPSGFLAVRLPPGASPSLLEKL